MTRDMTPKQFREALKRRGFRWSLLWIELGPNRPSVGMVMRHNGRRWVNDYRGTLAKAIRYAEHLDEMELWDRAADIKAGLEYLDKRPPGGA